MNLADTKYDKSAAYLLKKEELREKRRQLEGQSAGSDHRSNIDRLKGLIRNSRVFAKTSDSGVEKMTRALEKVLSTALAKVETNSGERGAFERLKRHTMVSSSSNM
jgi:hypothetical protein